MKVKVKDTAVYHDGQRYEKGESLEIKKDEFQDGLFEEVTTNGKTRAKQKKEDE